MEGFLHYWFGGLILILEGLHMEGLIFRILQYLVLLDILVICKFCQF